jgi:hypothetical protein
MMYDGLCAAVGTLVLSKFVAESFYEHNTTGPNGPIYSVCVPDDNTCCGPSCFKDAHFIIAAVSGTCVLSSLAVLIQTRPLYRQLIRELRVKDLDYS